jgi:DNA-binding IclR family transcriptional regulator
MTGFNKSTSHHILQTLASHGYIQQHLESKKYALGYKFLEISAGIIDNIDIRWIAKPYLRQIQEESQEAVHLTILRGGEVIYIDKVSPPGNIVLSTYVGFATEAYAHAGGKMMLSALTEEEVKALYQNRPLITRGKNTITDLDELLVELRRVKEEGYAIDDEEFREGIRCVAAPVRAGKKVVAAISISGSIFTMTRERINRDLIGLVMRTAEKISSEMNW